MRTRLPRDRSCSLEEVAEDDTRQFVGVSPCPSSAFPTRMTPNTHERPTNSRSKRQLICFGTCGTCGLFGPTLSLVPVHTGLLQIHRNPPENTCNSHAFRAAAESGREEQRGSRTAPQCPKDRPFSDKPNTSLLKILQLCNEGCELRKVGTESPRPAHKRTALAAAGLFTAPPLPCARGPRGRGGHGGRPAALSHRHPRSTQGAQQRVTAR